VTIQTLNQLAIAIARFSTRILPPGMQQWGAAMQHEVEAINGADRAFRFAVGCLGFALRQALNFYVLHPLQSITGAANPTGKEAITMNIKNDLFLHPQRVAALCAIMATGLGLVYMNAAGAPAAYLAMNSGALVFGFSLVGMVGVCAQSGWLSTRAISLVLGGTLFLTSLYGVSVNGATRWISLGGVAIQPSLIILPALAIFFATSRNALSSAGIVVASLALAMQPDRAMSGALAAGMVALVFLRPDRNVMTVAAAAACGFVASMLQADIQPAMPYVDQILCSSFEVHPLAGLAVLAGAALMILPSIIGSLYDVHRVETYVVFGTVWLAIIIAAGLGNYPTPLVGYGGSAIIGYVICLVGLPKRSSSIALDGHEKDKSLSAPEQRDLYVGLSYSL
jgi:cell division protein FtsW (lipid II flippase)